jgi:endonuclease G
MKRFVIAALGFAFSFTSVSAEDINFIPASNNRDIVKHAYYTLSYIDRYKDAEWVAYILEDFMTVGNTKRTNRFKRDPDVSSGSALPADYAKSGYDKGHLCPAADMKWNAKAMDETFYMSNMSPQEPGFNRGIWKELEEQVRAWAVELKKVYVVTGSILNDSLPTIGSANTVSVPKYLYKIILYHDDHENKAIAFLLPNESSTASITKYVVPIDSIETLTRINFFPSLSEQLSEKLEKRVDISNWHFIVRHHKDS